MKKKNKTHQELIKEIWDDADKSAMDILDEPIDLNLERIHLIIFFLQKKIKNKINYKRCTKRYAQILKYRER